MQNYVNCHNRFEDFVVIPGSIFYLLLTNDLQDGEIKWKK